MLGNNEIDNINHSIRTVDLSDLSHWDREIYYELKDLKDRVGNSPSSVLIKYYFKHRDIVRCLEDDWQLKDKPLRDLVDNEYSHLHLSVSQAYFLVKMAKLEMKLLLIKRAGNRYDDEEEEEAGYEQD